MARMTIATPLATDLCTLTVGPTSANAPASNLVTDQPGQVARFTDLANAYIVVDRGASAGTFNQLALLNHTAADGSTWRVRASAASAAACVSAPSYDSTALGMFAAGTRPADYTTLHSLLWLGDSALSERYVRIDIAATNAESYVDVGRLLCESAWQPSRTIQSGYTNGLSDDAPADVAQGGQLWMTDRGRDARRRTLDFSLRYLSRADIYAERAAFDIDRLCGRGRPVLVCPDPAETTYLHREMIYGAMTELPALTVQKVRLHEKRYHVEEMVP